MKVIALTVSTKAKVWRWNMADYPDLMLGHKYCVEELSDINPDEITATGWVYEDGSEQSVEGRWMGRRK